MIIASLALGLTWLLLFPVRWVLSRLGVHDLPNERSSHTTKTVRGGGVGIVLVVGCWMSYYAWNLGSPKMAILFVAYFGIATVSFIDDVCGSSPILRLSIQAAASLAALVVVEMAPGEKGMIRWICELGIGWFWIVGYCNAFNFMDGINGLAGTQAVVTALGTAAIALSLGVPEGHPAVLLSLVCAGAALGFLPHNFPRPKVFMGDVSSATFGFLLAMLAVWVSQLTAFWVLIWLGLLHANFVLDTGITILRRALHGQRILDAHREHFYQRLVGSGYSHTRVTLIQTGIQVLVVAVLVVTTPNSLLVKSCVGMAIFLVWLMFFRFVENKVRA